MSVGMQLLQERIAEIEDSDEMLMKVGRDIVDFHGEMVLLENYSALNYTGWWSFLFSVMKLPFLVQMPLEYMYVGSHPDVKTFKILDANYKVIIVISLIHADFYNL